MRVKSKRRRVVVPSRLEERLSHRFETRLSRFRAAVETPSENAGREAGLRGLRSHRYPPCAKSLANSQSASDPTQARR